MTLITAELIREDPEVYAAAFGPVDGKFGIYIGTMHETPSGHKRPRALMTSPPKFDTAEEAKTAAEALVAEVRANRGFIVAASPRRDWRPS